MIVTCLHPLVPGNLMSMRPKRSELGSEVVAAICFMILRISADYANKKGYGLYEIEFLLMSYLM